MIPWLYHIRPVYHGCDPARGSLALGYRTVDKFVRFRARHVKRECVLQTLSASLYMDFGDGRGTALSGGLTISALRDARFSSDPNGAKSIVSV